MAEADNTTLGDLVEFWPLDRLSAYERNAKKHGDEQVEGIAASIVEFGWTVPALVRPSGKLIAGHGRDLAAALIYRRGGSIRMASGAVVPAGTIPVIVARGWSEAQCRAYAIADNRLTELGEWDDELLRLELGELQESGFDLGLTGFSGDALAVALGLGEVEGNADPDDIPELPADPTSCPGDIWLLGNHRLICGDCTDAEVVARLLRGDKPHLMVTDPPPMGSGTIRLGAMMRCGRTVVRSAAALPGGFSTTTRLIGARRGRYSMATLLTSGARRCTRMSSPTA